MSKQPYVKLNNGADMPLIGFGTSVQKENENGEMIIDSNDNRIRPAVEKAVEVGYRHFDCADSYGNQRGIGQALRKSLNSATVKREDLFIATKVWNTDHKRERAQRSVMESLQKLQLDYVDLCYIHWPCNFREGDDKFPKESDGKTIAEGTQYDYLETYGALEDLVDSGKIKAIGLSNFDPDQIERIVQNCRTRPAVLQIEVHVYLQQNKMQSFCREHNIALIAYSPLASAHRAEKSVPRVDQDETLAAIARKLGNDTTPQQVALAFLLQRGICVIPRALSEDHMRSNFKAASVKLSAEDMSTISGLDKELSTFPISISRTAWSHLKYFPKEVLGAS